MQFLSYTESNKVCILNTTQFSFRTERSFGDLLARPTQTLLGAPWSTVMKRRNWEHPQKY